MAIRNGEPYIPPIPICPIGRDGSEFTIQPEMFEILSARGVRDTPIGNKLTNITGMFDPNFDDDTFVGTGLIQTSDDSRLGQIADRIAAHPDRDHINYRAGQILCRRVVMCRGLTIHGDCSALGNGALPEVIEKVAEEFGIADELR